MYSIYVLNLLLFSFVTLLEHVEESLGMNSIIMCVPKSRSDRGNVISFSFSFKVTFVFKATSLQSVHLREMDILVVLDNLVKSHAVFILPEFSQIFCVINLLTFPTLTPLLSHPVPNPDEERKLTYFLNTSLWCFKRFFEGLHKTFWGTCEIKIKVNFHFNTIFWNKRGGKG